MFQKQHPARKDFIEGVVVGVAVSSPPSADKLIAGNDVVSDEPLRFGG